MDILKRAKRNQMKEDEGPFRANRILNTNEVKIDQVYTKEQEKPVALFIHTTEDEVRKIGAGGYAGPTKIGGEGKYARDIKWFTRAIYFPHNIPGAKLDATSSNQILASVVTGGTIVPGNVTFEKVSGEKSIPMTGSSILRTNEKGFAEISGSFVASGPAGSRSFKILQFCPHCQADVEVGSSFCPKCGKNIKW